MKNEEANFEKLKIRIPDFDTFSEIKKKIFKILVLSYHQSTLKNISILMIVI